MNLTEEPEHDSCAGKSLSEFSRYISVIEDLREHMVSFDLLAGKCLMTVDFVHEIVPSLLL